LCIFLILLCFFFFFCLFFFFFFFSSRRRHTRFSRDWSSDVCSSDLVSGGNSVHDLVDIEVRVDKIMNRIATGHVRPPPPLSQSRSEERRVGKEWRSRRAQEQGKKKDNKEDKTQREKKTQTEQ